MKKLLLLTLFTAALSAQTNYNGGAMWSGPVALKSYLYGYAVAPPAGKPTLAVGSAGSPTGTFYYWVSYVTALGETEIPHNHENVSYDMSAIMVAGPVSPSSQRVNLTNIPVSTDPRVTGRNIYRGTASDGAQALRLTVGTTISDNTTTTYTDNAASGLGFQGYPDNTTANWTYTWGTVDNSQTQGLIRTGFIGNGLVTLGRNTPAPPNTEQDYYYSVYIGDSAGQNITGGLNKGSKFITAIGGGALSNLVQGEDLVAIGTVAGQSLNNSNLSTLNVMIGSHAVRGGGSNPLNETVCVGAYCGHLWASASGAVSDYSAALGSHAYQSHTNGPGDVGMGYNVGVSEITGSYNNLIGYQADVTSSSQVNCTAIGKNAKCTADSTIALGGATSDAQKVNYYNGTGLSGVGFPSIVGVSNVTGQSASQTTVTLATAPAAGSYLIRYYVDQAALCSTGTNIVAFTFAWTDGSLARTSTTGNFTLVASTAATSYITGTVPIFVASGNVTYTSTVTGACATGTSTYDIHASVERTQ